MDYVKAFLTPFVKDKAVWIAVIVWALKLANTHLHLGLNDAMVTSVAATISASAAAHMAHAKFFGGDGKEPTEDELKK